MSGTAAFSSCGLYRYTLTRNLRDQVDLFSPLTGTIAFCMLNPSTADAEKDDPTIRRCMGFAKGWGYAKLLIVNLYAYRDTKPANLWIAEKRGIDIVGADNDSAIGRAAGEAQMVICAWGNDAELGRARKVCKLIGQSKLRCLGISKIGAPWHPLYLPGDLEPMVWGGA